MNILLDAYFDNNFGDDIFIKVITGMFPACKFYAFLEYYPSSVCNWAKQIPNLYLLPECNVFLDKNMFDAYLCVGGDIFPDGGDFTKRKKAVQSVKQGNGVVAFLGFSLFHEYRETTKQDIKELMQQADIIAPRDNASAKILKSFLPNQEILVMADFAFSFYWPKQKEGKKNCLGISVRRPNYAKDVDMQRYCDSLAKAVNGYLEQNPEGRVKLFSLSDSVLSDNKLSDLEVSKAIIEQIKDKNKIEQVRYIGNLEEIQTELLQCDIVLCTRLHAMIACIAMDILFLPIVYEVKMEHILEEIGYTKAIVSFEKMEGLEGGLKEIQEELQLKGLQAKEIIWNEAKKQEYLKQSKDILEKLKNLLQERAEISSLSHSIVKQDMTDAVCQEKEYGRKQAAIVIQKNQELEDMAKEVQKQNKALEENQMVIKQYAQTIEECQITIKQYLETIEQCNKTNAEYAKLIEELNQKRAELENLLNMIRPYIMNEQGQKAIKVLNRFLKKRNPNVEENWNQILQYYGK